MQIASWKFWSSVILSFLLGWGLSYITHTKSVRIEDKLVEMEESPKSLENGLKSIRQSKSYQNSSEAPPYVFETLEYILEHNEAPDGYVGGRVFQNREGLLPETNPSGKRYEYREWDVHPKMPGKNRGAERLVISNEQDAYFTSDHYRSFKKIK